MFDAYREAVRSSGTSRRSDHRGVGHCCEDLDQRLRHRRGFRRGRTTRCARLRDAPPRRRPSAGRDHPTKGVHLGGGPGRDLDARRRDTSPRPLALSADRNSAIAIALEQCRSIRTARVLTPPQEGVEGTRDWSSGVLQESEPFMQLEVPGHQRPRRRHRSGRRDTWWSSGVPRRRRGRGALQIWSGERVIHDELGTPACAILAMAAMSATRSSGLLGVSSHSRV